MTGGASSTTHAATSVDAGPGRLDLLGIRHHGPGSARSVLSALDQLQPNHVLVELPADATEVLSWVGHPGLTPPVALLGYVIDDVSCAAFWPLAEFSPEWQAIRWAHEHHAELRAIDVPVRWTLAERAAREGSVEPHVDPLGLLAGAAGEPDAERWWDDVVEHRGDGAPAFAAIAEAMAAVRAGVVTSSSDARREAHMRQAIRAVFDVDGHRPDGVTVAVVCGAWHVPALDPGATSPKADAALLASPAHTAKVAVTWVPWSDSKLQHRSGYGAGIASPGWYRHVFRHPGPDGVARFFVEAAAAMRACGLAVSPDHLIGASRLAETIATLRERPRASLAELLDAAGAVVGDSAGRLPPVIDELTRGTAVGAVPDDAPQVPLVRDVAAAQRAARLTPKVGRRTLELDLRTPNGRRRSHLLHRLAIVGFEWASLEAGRGSRSTFRETWEVAWDPSMSIRLVECASYGTTLIDAATAIAIERGSSSSQLAPVASLVNAALLADLPDAVSALARSLGALAARAPDVAQLIDAVVPLSNALRYGDVRGSDSAALAAVVDEMVVRVVAGLAAACRRLDDVAATAMVERLSSLQGALAVLDHRARHDDLPRLLESLADAVAVHGLIRGRATRLLHDGGTWDPSAVSQRVGRALTSGTPPAHGARFIEGFVAGSGTVLVHDRELLGVIDTWISSMPVDAFTDAVALLRRTFGAFEPAERRQIGLLVTEGERDARPLAGDELDAGRVAAGLATVRLMLGLPPATDVEVASAGVDRDELADRHAE